AHQGGQDQQVAARVGAADGLAAPGGHATGEGQADVAGEVVGDGHGGQLGVVDVAHDGTGDARAGPSPVLPGALDQAGHRLLGAGAGAGDDQPVVGQVEGTGPVDGQAAQDAGVGVGPAAGDQDGGGPAGNRQV